MTHSDQSFRSQIRLWKNYWVKQYLHFRVYQNPDPYRITLRKRPVQILWMLSHMRSGSSLLTHILNANPEVMGYGETHIRYESSEDFKRLMCKVYWEGQEYRTLSDWQKLTLQETYILDKLLHNNKLLDPDLLSSENIHVLFLVREPQRTLNSIRDLKPDWTEAETLSHYCNRLKGLVTYAEKIDNPARSLLIRHDQLINESSQVFTALQTFLGTQAEFTEKYQLLKTTGAKHVGDHRGKIMAGQIVRTQRELKETVSQASVDQAQDVYQDCLQRLSQLSIPIKKTS
ncbi:MAG: sulfotransferase family protein [Cyanobacteria bacterium J06626_18]